MKPGFLPGFFCAHFPIFTGITSILLICGVYAKSFYQRKKRSITMKRFFIMTLIISMFALAGCTTTTDDGTTTADSENTSQENTNQNDQNTENENKNEENDTPAQPTLTGSTVDCNVKCNKRLHTAILNPSIF